MSEALSAKDVYRVGVLFESIDNCLLGDSNPKGYLEGLESILKKSEHLKELSGELRIWIRVLEDKNDKLDRGTARVVKSEILRIRGHCESILDDRFNINEI